MMTDLGRNVVERLYRSVSLTVINLPAQFKMQIGHESYIKIMNCLILFSARNLARNISRNAIIIISMVINRISLIYISQMQFSKYLK